VSVRVIKPAISQPATVMRPSTSPCSTSSAAAKLLPFLVVVVVVVVTALALAPASDAFEFSAHRQERQRRSFLFPGPTKKDRVERVSPRYSLFTDPTSRKGRRTVNGDDRASYLHGNTNQQQQQKPKDGGNATATVISTPATTTEQGIGGDGGWVYDVNRLKRNLLQETTSAYKNELWSLLESPRSTEAAIVRKLAALVQASAVRTTTDSNLLDGRWTLAYTSKKFSVADLREPSTAASAADSRRNAKKKTTGGLESSTSGGGDAVAESLSQQPGGGRVGNVQALFSTRQWTYYLETDLEDDEGDENDDDTAYCVEHVRRLGGAWLKSTTWAVTGLTRQSLALQRVSQEVRVLGQRVHQRKDEDLPPGTPPVRKDVQVAYLDVDLAIVSESSPSSKKGTTFAVYTKNKSWHDPSARASRKFRYVLESLEHFVFRSLGRHGDDDDDGDSKRYTRGSWKNPQEEVDRILREIEMDSSKLRVLRLGDVDLGKDDEAWEGIADPFAHLSADERQKKLKAMSVRQVAKAGNRRLSRAKRWRWFRRLFSGLIDRRGRRSFFKKPDV